MLTKSYVMEGEVQMRNREPGNQLSAEQGRRPDALDSVSTGREAGS